MFKFNADKQISLRSVLSVLGCLAALAGAFALGVAVGNQKAEFSNRWGDNYYRNFGGQSFGGRAGFSGGMMGGFRDSRFFGGHGADGQVISRTDNSLAIKSPDGTERGVVVGTDTAIRRFRSEIQLSDINIGDAVVVIGQPDEAGRIQARLIRVMPAK